MGSGDEIGLRALFQKQKVRVFHPHFLLTSIIKQYIELREKLIQFVFMNRKP